MTETTNNRSSSKKTIEPFPKNSPLVTIITVVYNAQPYIEETILSIISQTYKNIEYIIIDGGSTDGTVDIIKKYEDHIDYWISEEDNSMYDALAKAFSRVKGTILGYLNAGDLYSKHAIDIVVDVFKTKKVKWITGLAVTYNEKSWFIGNSLPYKYRRKLIQKGMYVNILPFIQQESTFWSQELISLVDIERLSSFKYAGDYYLWNCFAIKEKLYIVNAYLGGFKKHRNQLSTNMNEYLNEVNSITVKPGLKDYIVAYIDRLMWVTPVKVKKIFNKNGLYTYNCLIDQWD